MPGPWHAAPTVTTIERLTRAWARELGGSTPVRAGPEQTVELGGTACVAEPFIVGRGLSTTNWCVALLPSRTTARTGLRVMMGVGVPVGSEPDCTASRRHRRLAPLADSIRLD